MRIPFFTLKVAHEITTGTIPRITAGTVLLRGGLEGLDRDDEADPDNDGDPGLGGNRPGDGGKGAGEADRGHEDRIQRRVARARAHPLPGRVPYVDGSGERGAEAGRREGAEPIGRERGTQGKRVPCGRRRFDALHGGEEVEEAHRHNDRKIGKELPVPEAAEEVAPDKARQVGSYGAGQDRRARRKAGGPCQRGAGRQDHQGRGDAAPRAQSAEEEKKRETERDDPDHRVREEVEEKVESQEREPGAGGSEAEERSARRQPSQALRDKRPEELDRARAQAGDEARLPRCRVGVRGPLPREAQAGRRGSITRNAKAIIVGVFRPNGIAHTSVRFSRRASLWACHA